MPDQELEANPGRFRPFIGLVAGPLVAVFVFILLPSHYRDQSGELTSLSHAGRATTALMIWMAVWWFTEAIDISATALLPLVLLPLTGAATMKASAAPYASELIFLFMGGFLMALSMQRWGLDRRIALITLRVIGTRRDRMVAGFMIVTAMLSAFVSNTATAAMMLPIGLGVIDLARRHRGESIVPGDERNFSTCMMLGIAYSASIGGVATIIGSPPNAFLVGFASESLGQQISFIAWMSFGVPLAAIFLPITWFLLTRVLYPVDRVPIAGGQEFLRQAYAALGPFNRGQLATLIVFCMAALAWMFRPLLSDLDIGGVAPFKQLGDAGIAMTAAIVLFAIPASGAEHRFVMDWKAVRQLPWGILILFGGGLSLAEAIHVNGVAEFIGAHTHRIGAQPLILVLAVTTAIVFLSEVASNTATATTLVPILAALAAGLGVDPYLLIVPATLAASCAFMLPAGTPPNAMVFGTGFVTMRQMIRAGFVLNLCGIVLISAVCMLIAKHVLTSAAP